MELIEIASPGVECNWKATADTKEELLEKASKHAQSAHGIKELNEAMNKKIIESMKDIDCI